MVERMAADMTLREVKDKLDRIILFLTEWRVSVPLNRQSEWETIQAAIEDVQRVRGEL
jgi:hypothetical protein